MPPTSDWSRQRAFRLSWAADASCAHSLRAATADYRRDLSELVATGLLPASCLDRLPDMDDDLRQLPVLRQAVVAVLRRLEQVTRPRLPAAATIDREEARARLDVAATTTDMFLSTLLGHPATCRCRPESWDRFTTDLEERLSELPYPTRYAVTCNGVAQQDLDGSVSFWQDLLPDSFLDEFPDGDMTGNTFTLELAGPHRDTVPAGGAGLDDAPLYAPTLTATVTAGGSGHDERMRLQVIPAPLDWAAALLAPAGNGVVVSHQLLALPSDEALTVAHLTIRAASAQERLPTLTELRAQLDWAARTPAQRALLRDLAPTWTGSPTELVAAAVDVAPGAAAAGR